MEERKRDERFPGNSYNSIATKKPAPVKALEQVAKGREVVKKKKLGDFLFASDIKSVFGYIFEDILIPAAKDMLSDLVGGAVNMMLFGDHKGRRSESRDDRSRNYTDYSRYSGRKRDDENDRRPVRGKPTDALKEIAFDYRDDAKRVLARLRDQIEDYDDHYATVNDYYQFAGSSSDYTKRKFGWYNLDDVEIVRTRDGFVVDLPKPQVLN